MMRAARTPVNFALASLLVMPIAPLILQTQAIAEPGMTAQPAAIAEVQAQPTVEELLLQGKVQFRRAEFRRAIATYQQILQQSGSSRGAKVEALLQLGEISFWIEQVPQAETYLQQALKLARDGQDRRGEAWALAGLGDVYRNRQEYPKALETLNTALTIAQQMGDRGGEARSRLILGSVFYWQGQYAKALEAFQLAVKVAQADNNQHEVALIYAWMAAAYRELKDVKQAEALLKQQQALSQSLGDRMLEYSGLGTLAYWQQQQNQMDGALQTYQRQLAIAQAADNPWFVRSAWLAIGGFYVSQKEMPKALEAYQQALAVAQTIDDAAVGDVRNKLGNVYHQMKQYPQALDEYQKALASYQKLNRSSAIAQTWMDIGQTYYSSEQYPQALAAFQQALKFYQAEKRPREIAQAWQKNAYTYLSQKQYSEALEAFQKVLEIARAIPNRALELDALTGQGFVYSTQGARLSNATEYQAAIASHEKSLGIWQQAQTLARELKNDRLEQNAIWHIQSYYFNRGSIFSNQHRHAEAISAYQQGLAFWRQHRDRLLKDRFLDTEQLLLTQLGIAYDDNGQYIQALATYQESLRIAEQQNDPQQQQQMLRFISSTYSKLGDNQKALETSQQMLALVREKLKQDPVHEMGALIRVAQSFGNLGQLDAELKYYQEALAIARARKDVLTESTLLSNISNNYSDRGEYLQALEPPQQAFIQLQTGIRRLEAGDVKVVEQLCGKTTASLGMEGQKSCLQMFQSALSSMLNNLAFAYNRLGRYPEALKTYEQGLEIAQQYKDLDGQATFFNNIGNVYLSTGNYPRALDFFQQALKFALASGTRPMQASILNNIGQVYSEQGQTTPALSYHQQSLDLAQVMQSPKVEATALNNLGSSYETQGNFEQALEFYQRALTICRKHGFSTTTELNNIAGVYAKQGKYNQSVDLLQQALETARKAGDRPQEVNLLRNIGAIYQAQSTYAMALKFYQQAQELSQKMGNRPSELSGLFAQGRVYLDLGQYLQALELFQKALNLSRDLGQKASEAYTLGNIANVYRKQSNYPQALQLHQQSLTLFREIGNVSMESVILKRLAETYERQGNPTQAATFLQQALTIQRKIGARPEEAMTLSTLGPVYTAQGKIVEAQETLQQALEIAQSVNDRATQAQALRNLAQLFVKQNQPELAIVFYKQSVSLTETIRRELGTLPKDQQQSYTETVADTYRELADLLLKSDRILEAQQILDLLKVQELDDYLRNVRGTGKPLYDIPPEQAILKKYNALQQSAIALGRELNTLEEQARSGKSLTPTQQQRKSELLALQKDLKQQFLDFAKQPDIAALLKQLTPDEIEVHIPLRDLAGFSKKLAKLNAVMIYPLVLSDRLELIITAPNAQPLRRTVNISRQELNQTIQDFRAALQNPRQDPKPHAQKLYTWLIKPLEADLKTAQPSTLIYAPDGQLRYIPLAALHDGQQWLVQRYGINNITAKSLDDLTELPQRQLRVFAGAFGTTNQQVPFAGQTFSFPGLTFATREVENLAKLVPGTTTLFGPNFTQDSTTNKMNEFNVVHFATHASLVPQSGNSFIVFGNGQATSLSEIERWTLDNVDLIVLSACETALGGKFGNNGEEVLGLGYQFTRKDKAKAAIASLWQVDDGGTQALMTIFYKALKQQKTKTAALQIAQQALIRGEFQSLGITRSELEVESTRTSKPIPAAQLSHPYYWAPFILIGNGL